MLMQFRLDKRTKRDFYNRVADNKGVDVSVAIQHLKQAHRKTGMLVNVAFFCNALKFSTAEAGNFFNNRAIF